MKKLTALLLALAVLLCSCAVSNAPAPQPEENSSSTVSEAASDSSRELPEPPVSSASDYEPMEFTPAMKPLAEPKTIDIPEDKANIITWIMDEDKEYPLESANPDRKRAVDVHIPQINLNGKTADMINREIRAKFYNTVQYFINHPEDLYYLDFQTYSQVALYEDYLSIRIDHINLPNGQFVGETYTVVYDTKNDVIIPFDVMLEETGLTSEDIYNAVQKATFDYKLPVHFECDNYIINSDGSIDFICEYVSNADDIPWNNIYTYTYYPDGKGE